MLTLYYSTRKEEEDYTTTSQVDFQNILFLFVLNYFTNKTYLIQQSKYTKCTRLFPSIEKDSHTLIDQQVYYNSLR